MQTERDTHTYVHSGYTNQNYCSASIAFYRMRRQRLNQLGANILENIAVNKIRHHHGNILFPTKHTHLIGLCRLCCWQFASFSIFAKNHNNCQLYFWTRKFTNVKQWPNKLCANFIPSCFLSHSPAFQTIHKCRIFIVSNSFALNNTHFSAFNGDGVVIVHSTRRNVRLFALQIIIAQCKHIIPV